MLSFFKEAASSVSSLACWAREHSLKHEHQRQQTTVWPKRSRVQETGPDFGFLSSRIDQISLPRSSWTECCHYCPNKRPLNTKTRGRIFPLASMFMYSCSLADVSWGHSFHHLSAARLILFRVVGIWNKSQNALGREPDTHTHTHTHTHSDSLPAHRVSLESHDVKIIKDKDQNSWLMELVTHTFTSRYKFSTHNTDLDLCLQQWCCTQKLTGAPNRTEYQFLDVCVCKAALKIVLLFEKLWSSNCLSNIILMHFEWTVYY